MLLDWRFTGQIAPHGKRGGRGAGEIALEGGERGFNAGGFGGKLSQRGMGGEVFFEITSG